MKTRSIAPIVALAGWTLGAVGACSSGGNPPSTFEEPSSPPPAGGGGSRPSEPAQPETLATFSPDEVMTLAEVLDLGEVEQGRLAQQQATHPEVKAFAKRLVEEHGQALQRIQRLTGEQLTAEAPRTRVAEDTTASMMYRQQQLLTSDLGTQKGATFDLAYMTARVTEQAKALALIDRALLPSIGGGAASSLLQAGPTGGAGGSEIPPGAAPTAPSRDALEAELQTMRTAFSNHLVEALRVQKALRTGALAPATQGAGPRTEAAIPGG